MHTCEGYEFGRLIESYKRVCLVDFVSLETRDGFHSNFKNIKFGEFGNLRSNTKFIKLEVRLNPNKDITRVNSPKNLTPS